jgi:hypothetical protein
MSYFESTSSIEKEFDKVLNGDSYFDNNAEMTLKIECAGKTAQLRITRQEAISLKMQMVTL